MGNVTDVVFQAHEDKLRTFDTTEILIRFEFFTKAIDHFQQCLIGPRIAKAINHILNMVNTDEIHHRRDGFVDKVIEVIVQVIAIWQTGHRIKLDELFNMLTAFFLFQRQRGHMLADICHAFDKGAGFCS
ncbi:Uncharacterised protein [Shigella sonnei]|nr:Uncharacterised protein [Shigella sonnei]CSE45000.1 Uncharacterised protein [Shigella sonnei]CSE65757.1 Uncharacterised protein [Shigella sonnei]CSE72408.1 Uncharacterised protein [Shigella sonnei]CSF01301.1 Uncharacterised protein [Shigella sonnei]